MRALALLALAAALAGCIAAPGPAPVEPQQLPTAPAFPTEDLTFSETGTAVTTLPVIGGEESMGMSVPEGARWMAHTVTWQTRGTVLQFIATDPEGREVGESRTLAGTGPRSPARLDWWVADPVPGEWTFTIRGDGSLPPMMGETVTIQTHFPREITGMHVAQATQVPAAGFVEVNMEMLAGQTLTYVWTAASPVYFNIHTHRNGETINLVEDTVDAMQAVFTAEEEGGYSLLWAAATEGAAPLPGGEAVALEYRVDGQYELHSAVG